MDKPLYSKTRTHIGNIKWLINNCCDDAKIRLKCNNCNTVSVFSCEEVTDSFNSEDRSGTLSLVFECVIHKNEPFAMAVFNFYYDDLNQELIKQLENYLPEVLVKNKAMHSILSKGVHQLAESECNDYFPIIFKGIVMILEEELERIQKSKDEEELTKEIYKITNKLKN